MNNTLALIYQRLLYFTAIKYYDLISYTNDWRKNLFYTKQVNGTPVLNMTWWYEYTYLLLLALTANID